jgi:hypothetical protein
MVESESEREKTAVFWFPISGFDVIFSGFDGWFRATDRYWAETLLALEIGKDRHKLKFLRG